MRVFEPEPELRNYRLNKIGFRNHLLYVSPHRQDTIQVWSLHSFIPNSWRCIIDFPLIQLLHSSYTLSPIEEFVYILAVALFDSDVPRVAILQINTGNGELKTYNLDIAAGDEFENKVFLENVVIGCGDRQLYMYDRTIVMGAIPFWNVTLLEDVMTFIITSKAIPAEESPTRCSRFPIVLDGDERKVLKINDNHSVSVYDGKGEKWDTYFPSFDSNLDLNEVWANGVTKTYGPLGFRVGAVESPLSIFTGFGNCIAKVYRHGIHSFYNIDFDDLTKEYRVTPASSCRLPLYIQRKFYVACSDTEFVFICPEAIAFAQMYPATLGELAFSAVQRQFSKVIQGRWSGGISEQKVKEFCAYKNKKSIL